MTSVPYHLASLAHRDDTHIQHRLHAAIAKSNRDLMRRLARISKGIQ